MKGVGDMRNLGASTTPCGSGSSPMCCARLAMTVADVQTAMRAQNVVNPAGQIGAEPAPSGQQFTYTVRAQGRLVTPERVRRRDPAREPRRVARCACATWRASSSGSLNYGSAGPFNGKPSACHRASSSSRDRTLSTWRRGARHDGGAQVALPSRDDYAVSLDTTAPVKAGIQEILTTLFEAMRSSCWSSSSSCRAGAPR